MALNPSPNYPPIGDGPYKIDRQWCMGDSLPFINENFKIFDDRILALSSTFVKQISGGNNITVTPTLTSNIIAISNTTSPAIVQVQYVVNTSGQTTIAQLPATGSVPPGAGTAILTKSITPILNNGVIRINASAIISNQTPANGAAIVLWKISTPTDIPLATTAVTTTESQNLSITYYDTITTTTTYRIDMYTYNGGQVALNRDSWTKSRGGTFRSYLTLEEIRQ
jgi:hypothetical protein